MGRAARTVVSWSGGTDSAMTLYAEEDIGEHIVPYLDRLSDAMLVMSRYENQQSGAAEPLWQPGQ